MIRFNPDCWLKKNTNEVFKPVKLSKNIFYEKYDAFLKIKIKVIIYRKGSSEFYAWWILCREKFLDFF
jgi:hypothetical protein